MSFLKSMKNRFRRVSVSNAEARQEEATTAAAMDTALSLSPVADEDAREDSEPLIFYEEPMFEYMFSLDETGTKLEELSAQLQETNDGDEVVSLVV
jgi:hypothetical protein